MTQEATPIDIDILPTAAAQTPALEGWWCSLQERADASMFLSWSWIGCWLASLPPHIEVQVVKAERAGVLVGLALLVVAPLGGLRAPLGLAAHLHSTGNDAYDGITIEHNGLLLDRAHARTTHAAMLQFLCDAQRRWSAVRLPGLTPGQAIATESLPPGIVMQIELRACPVVALQPVRDRGGDYLGLLSAKRRAHIRRSMRACAEGGPLVLSAAVDAASASSYFERLLKLHVARRASLGLTSAFDLPFSRAFHRRLVAEGLPRGEVQLLRLQAGGRDVGYLYNFVHRGRVSFYQSGFDFGCVDHKFSPGLVTLALAIEHNARLGHDCFDFLAGDTQYKRTLATHSESMGWVDLRRGGALLSTENALHRAARLGRSWLRGRLALALTSLGIALAGMAYGFEWAI